MTELSAFRIFEWDGNDIGDGSSIVYVTYKIDGVRAIWTGNDWVSRAGHLLYNLPAYDLLETEATQFEVYNGSFDSTVSIVRRKNDSSQLIKPEDMYALWPNVDERLMATIGNFFDKTVIQMHLQSANQLGYEGLVYKHNDRFIKVKPKKTADLRVTGYKEGKGKFAGMLGVLLTDEGNIGTGFTDSERIDFWNRRSDLPGIVIEAEYMQRTKTGKLRHGRFLRERFDKDIET